MTIITDYAKISEQWRSGLAHNKVKQQELDQLEAAASYARWDREFHEAIDEAIKCNRKVAFVKQKMYETVPESLLRDLRQHFKVTKARWLTYGEECYVGYGWRKFLRMKTKPVTARGWEYIITLP